jgi:HPt (histidine-containing phosphotransfer) domain-containing protein
MNSYRQSILSRAANPETRMFRQGRVSTFDLHVLDQLAQGLDQATLDGLTRAFASDIESHVAGTVAAVANRDIEAVRQHVHALSGSAATFGAMRMHRLAHAVETLCRLGKPGLALGMAESLPREAQRVLEAMPEALALLPSTAAAAAPAEIFHRPTAD